MLGLNAGEGLVFKAYSNQFVEAGPRSLQPSDDQRTAQRLPEGRGERHVHGCPLCGHL